VTLKLLQGLPAYGIVLFDIENPSAFICHFSVKNVNF